MLKLSKWFSLLLTLVLTLAACGPSIELVSAKLPRNPQPQVGQTDLQTLVNGNNAFAFDLYRQIDSGPDNLFFSPYSISTALALIYAGARSNTESQMAASLHYLLPQDQLHPAFNQLALDLAQRAQAPGIKPDQAFQLHTVNAAWGQQGYTFLQDYLNVLAENYGTGMRLLNFQQDPEGSRQAINDWVSQQTQKRIQDIVPQGAIDSSTRLVVSNAIYFKADWASEFSKDATSPLPFTLSDGSQVSVPTMVQQHRFGYMAEDGLQALEMTYAGGDLSMLILLPAAGRFDEVQASLNADQLNEIVAALKDQSVKVFLPKFQFEAALGLNDPLQALGMTDAFDPDQADFSGMDGTHNLYVGQVLHKAFVAVDEAGTEAAAATVGIVEAVSLPEQNVPVFQADHPFIFLIRDNPTGTILFLGRVLNPQP